jgi:hypothetical protein
MKESNLNQKKKVLPIFGNMLYGRMEPQIKKALPIVAKPNLHKKKTLISNIECKNKPYKAQARGLDGDSKEP